MYGSHLVRVKELVEVARLCTAYGVKQQQRTRAKQFNQRLQLPFTHQDLSHHQNRSLSDLALARSPQVSSISSNGWRFNDVKLNRPAPICNSVANRGWIL